MPPPHQAFNMDSGDQNSGPCTCTSTSPSEHLSDSDEASFWYACIQAVQTCLSSDLLDFFRVSLTEVNSKMSTVFDQAFLKQGISVFWKITRT